MVEKFNWDKLADQAYKAYQRGDFSTSERLFQSAYKRLKKIDKGDARLGYAFMMIGACQYQKHNFKEAISYFKSAVEIYRPLGDQRLIDNLSWLGICFYHLGRWREASSEFLDAIKMYRILKCDKKHDLINTLAYCGSALWSLGKFDKAEAIFRKGITLGSPQSIPRASFKFLAETLLNLAAQNQKQLGAAQRLYRMAILSCKIFEGKLTKIKPPQTKTIDQRDNYFGTSICDPYRWLESTSSTNVKDWVKQQNLCATEYLECIPGRAVIHQSMWKLFRTTPSLPRKIGKYYFFKQTPLKDRRPKLFRITQVGHYPTAVFDENALPKDVWIDARWLSLEGRYFAYSLSDKGSDRVSLCVKDLETDKRIKERLTGLRWLHLSWKEDSSGFFYSSMSDSDRGQVQSVLFHKLNTKQTKDKLIYQGQDPNGWFSIAIVLSDKYLLISSCREGYLYSLKIKSLGKPDLPIRSILNEQKHKFTYVGYYKDRLFFITDKNAAKRKLVALKIGDKPSKKHRFVEILGEESALLEHAALFSNFIVGFYWTERGLVIRRFNYQGEQLNETRLPKYTGTKYVRGDDQEIFFKVQGYSYPVSIFRYTPEADQLSLFNSSEVSFDASQYTTELHHTRSRDGTRIPVYLSFKKGLKQNGSNPVMLTGYGGFDRCVRPAYSANNILWMDIGGIFAEAVVRGGGEFGSSWRSSGMLGQKQNTFDDFIAVAEYLINERFTKPAKLGIFGSSNGGLLVGAVLTQRPDLFGAAVIDAGLLDMLRYHEFDLARYYASEYGCANNKKDFRILYAYSPLHQLKQRNYPPVLVLAGANDDRVNPAHSYKFTATLQSCQTGSAPILLKVAANTGHGGHYNSTNGLDIFCFFGYHLGIIPKRLFSKHCQLYHQINVL